MALPGTGSDATRVLFVTAKERISLLRVEFHSTYYWKQKFASFYESAHGFFVQQTLETMFGTFIYGINDGADHSLTEIVLELFRLVIAHDRQKGENWHVPNATARVYRTRIRISNRQNNGDIGSSLRGVTGVVTKPYDVD